MALLAHTNKTMLNLLLFSQDAEMEQGISRPFDHYLLSISTIEVFIFLFAPLISYLKQSDFLTSFRLENGYKIWDPLFQHTHPEIPSFTAYPSRS